MKTKLFILLTLAIWVFTACEEKIDVTKEEEAIKAVFEEEKAGFLSQDYARMAETWIQNTSSIKIVMTGKGQTKFDGWDAVSKEDQRATSDNSWDRKLVTLSFTNYQINVMNSSAWVLCDAQWKGTMNDKPLESNQSRITVLKKVDGKWKFALMAIYNLPMVEKAANADNSAQNEQIELHKQFIGSWKAEIAKDTIAYWDVKPYGTGLDANFRFVSKGKTVMEGKVLWAYNNSAAKFTITETIKGVDNAIYSSWFDSKSICTMKYFGPASKSSEDIPEWKMEFKTPDTFINTTIKNNNPVKTEIWNRVK